MPVPVKRTPVTVHPPSAPCGMAAAWQVHLAPILMTDPAEKLPAGEASQMSGAGAAAPPALLSGLWHCGSVRRNSRLLPGSLPPGLRSRAPLRLPSLTAKAPRRRSSMARLSLSEPSLLSPGQDLQLDGCSGSRLSSCLQMRPPPPPPFSKPPTLLPCRNCNQQQNQQLQRCSRPAYIHFSRAIRPAARPAAQPAPVRRHSHNPDVSGEMLQGDFRRRNSSSCQGETLFVVGKPCFLGCGPRPTAAAGPAGRAQLHVFLPSEAKPEEADRESVDEGFMDELDCRITALKLQHTLTNNS
ncbi:uncharacterized protein LOC103143451 [Poecilia formosa]|uniref:uncharacterized protein LOC103143451 n=1 Tax=Poecilia formosa TaxID=48698 RepID=UPI0004444603|nr:PREDICTED: uncharacterized protein LOC103143451 [Poecilia formosa]